MSQLEDGRLLGDQRLQIDDGVDDVIDPAEREILIGFGIGGVFDDLAHLAAFLLQHGAELGKPGQQRAAGLHADRLAVQILDRGDALVVLALDIIMRSVGDRAREIERLPAFPGDDRGRDRNVVFAGADAGEDAGPGQDLLLDLERSVFTQILDQFVIEAGRLAILHELEGTEIVLSRNDQTTLLDLIEAAGRRAAGKYRHCHQHGAKAERQASGNRIGAGEQTGRHDRSPFRLGYHSKLNPWARR